MAIIYPEKGSYAQWFYIESVAPTFADWNTNNETRRHIWRARNVAINLNHLVDYRAYDFDKTERSEIIELIFPPEPIH